MICEFEKSHDTQLTQHFWLREFHCQCTHPQCVTTMLSIELVDGLEKIREILKKEWENKAYGKGAFPGIRVLSGFRCAQHNKDVGGKPSSRHLVGIAADICVTDIFPRHVLHAAKRVDIFQQGGIGLYSWGVHVDHRGYPARW